MRTAPSVLIISGVDQPYIIDVSIYYIWINYETINEHRLLALPKTFSILQDIYFRRLLALQPCMNLEIV